MQKKALRLLGLRLLGRILALSIILLALLFICGIIVPFLKDSRGSGFTGGGWFRLLPVKGESMHPALHQGDFAIIVPPPDKLEVGMVIAFLTDVPPGVVIHRIIAFEDGKIITQGDAYEKPDDFEVREVIGVCWGKIPYLGYLDLITHR